MKSGGGLSQLYLVLPICGPFNAILGPTLMPGEDQTELKTKQKKRAKKTLKVVWGREREREKEGETERERSGYILPRK